MRLSIVALGSRGDIQPYLALGLGLQRTGYQVQICADRLFENLVTSSGLPYAPVTGVPSNMMQQNLSRYGGPFKLLAWLEQHFRPLAKQFFADLKAATRDTDAILYSSLAFAGYHVAEKHQIPALAVYNIPITPTHAFQNLSAPSLPDWFPFKRAYNWWSFRIPNRMFIAMISPIVNECRRDVLGLRLLSKEFYRNLDISPLPIVYGFSPNIIPPPDDWGEWIKISGHWFLDEPADWQPPDELVRFLEAGKPPVYVGFGSMIDEQIKRTTPIILEALRRTGQRGILLGGWGGLGRGELTETVLCIPSAPHSWLFPRVAAVVHHGGAGTTATGLRNGKPTVVFPFFADQPFWGERVRRLGAGPKPIPFRKLNTENLSRAIELAVGDDSMRQKARDLGEKLRQENGVAKAVSLIQEFLN